MSGDSSEQAARLPAGNPVFGASAAADYRLLFLLAIAALTLFRLAALALSNTELFFDEAQYWFWSRELAFGYYSKPPLIAWIIRGATEICGESEACIRAPSPLIHAATAMVVFAIGHQLYGERIGFWSGLTYATLPGVSLSSSLISTDVPLLFFVALSLLSVVRLQAGGSWGWAAALGIGLGLGLMSKYAMVYFLLCLALYAAWTRAGRALLADARLYAALGIAAAIVAPNILWNAQNGFATFGHTADNANWRGSLLHPGEALEFFGGQFGVFGPVLFAAFLAYCVRWLGNADGCRGKAGDSERLLLSFCVPVLVLMLSQALLSRAHANWAAFAYIAATVLMTAALLRDGWTRLFRASLALHLAILVVIGAGGVLAGRLALPGGDPYARVLGWKALAEAAGEKARAEGFAAIATDRRALAAELLYYLRASGIPVVALRSGPPSDHFELTRPLDAKTPRPVLLVSLSSQASEGAVSAGSAEIPAGPVASRRVYFHVLK